MEEGKLKLSLLLLLFFFLLLWNASCCYASMHALVDNLSKNKLKGMPIQVKWAKPPPDIVKLNVNGCSKGNPGRAGIGGILRDDEGKLIFAFHENIGVENNMVAELKALHRGLELCLQRGLKKVWIETDSQANINLLSKTHKGPWSLQHLLSKIKEQLSRCEWAHITHIYREGNKTAD